MADGQQGGVPAPWHPTYDVDKVCTLEAMDAGSATAAAAAAAPSPRSDHTPPRKTGTRNKNNRSSATPWRRTRPASAT
jgi:hypothetical protein